MDYKTLVASATDELVEKKSRFIGAAMPVSSEEEALAFIEQRRASNREANHNVYAYILRSGQTKRYSDDGEPHGTAGVPVLEVLAKEGLTDAVVVVTRYFGGTLLGTGGLVRAYTAGAKIAIDAAGIKTMHPCTLIDMEFDYGFYGKLSYILPKYYIRTISADFGVLVKMTLLIKDSLLAAFKGDIMELSADLVQVHETEKLFESIEEN